MTQPYQPEQQQAPQQVNPYQQHQQQQAPQQAYIQQQQPYVNYYQQVPQGYSQKSKITAGLLGILLGGLGIHNFYLGKTGRAILQLLITLLSAGFLAWVTMIWAVFEGIFILTSKPGTKWHKDARGYELAD